MKKSILSLFVIVCMGITIAQEFPTIEGMPGYYRQPVVEEGIHNIILQNRCGNRLSMLVFKDSTGLEFAYKPNAYRRKDYRARNFSNRDNQTTLFASFLLPQIKDNDIIKFDYDPFVTKIHTKTQHGAKNEITFVNYADENVFFVAAKSPLLLSFKPYNSFIAEDGLLLEKFSDRGEQIISFVHFNSYEENRYRVLQDGSRVLQLYENEWVMIGGEDSEYQVNRVVNKFRGRSLNEIIANSENALKPAMRKGEIQFSDDRFQEVIDLNRRIVYSGIDEGGACFGAINRIYYLIWVRDGAMTSSLMARAGNPEIINAWAPFCINNPSWLRNEQGELVPDFQQILGSRWTKNEDDGIFYAMLSLFTYFQATGKDDLLYDDGYDIVKRAFDRFLQKTWDEKRQMIVSDTRGETPLKANPHFGYDVVNGNFERNDHHLYNGKTVMKSASLYNQVNTWNILKMLKVLMHQKGELKVFEQKYGPYIKKIHKKITTGFVAENGIYYMAYYLYEDGSESYVEMGNNPWEYSWANSVGPFFPDINLAIKSAGHVHQNWVKNSQDGYGYCPWNTISKMLYEYGLSGNEYKSMLQTQVDEALMETQRFPMQGALPEYKGRIESWRALPFSAGSFFFSAASQMVNMLPMGLAVRAGSNVDTINNYYYKLSNIDFFASGEGDIVKSYLLNGKEIKGSLQIPTNLLRAGKNEVWITRCSNFDQTRLYSSFAELIRIDEKSGRYHFYAPFETKLIFENLEKAEEISILSENGENLEYLTKEIEDSNKTILILDAKGYFTIKIKQ